ncbi:hypothetical protein EDEG_00553 [Edhazardia aedis USNM 41457]|uniref:Uncharacterized protein n=1 Tax=Edhazardia aedis (strain USNM 41457) TaxID=1003232 RepID=J9DF49_EDHAE|nr:hypothetical protein EDEG_00553 [Edhazardia aedis USNM 41457]|eukprot:EJW01220.1 hypothetical protein EDEG_00553 [Edhazardia aedis USNM 41457]
MKNSILLVGKTIKFVEFIKILNTSFQMSLCNRKIIFLLQNILTFYLFKQRNTNILFSNCSCMHFMIKFFLSFECPTFTKFDFSAILNLSKLSNIVLKTAKSHKPVRN